MTFLPIVHRELRIATRRRSTYRVRWWAAVFGMGLTLFSFIFAWASGGRSGGQGVFTLLTGYGLGIALLAGVFLTSDAVTEEKRDGTLGLLFLTDLKGYDVVLGKLSAQALHSFYCLFALLPVSALPLLLGGVMFAEIGRMALALANALFFSLAAGICVSAFMRDSHRAMVDTFGLLLLLAAALPVLNAFAGTLRIPAFWHPVALVSPYYPFSFAFERSYAVHVAGYWGSLAASHLLAWVFLMAASLVLPRVVQERPGTFEAPKAWARRVFRRRGGRAPSISTVSNPVEWLRRDELGVPWGAWLIAVASTVTVFLSLLLGGGPAVLAQVAIPLAFLLKALFAVQVCRFFAEARRNGALELLLCTPLTDQEIIRGQVRALWLTFAWPLALFVGGIFAWFAARIAGAIWVNDYEELMGIVGSAGFGVGYLIRLAADLFAILWFGMGLALTMKKPGLSTAWTILCVLILPAPLAFCWIDILVDLVLISWGTNKCRMNLRRLIAAQYVAPAAPEARSFAFPRTPPVIRPGAA